MYKLKTNIIFKGEQHGFIENSQEINQIYIQ